MAFQDVEIEFRHGKKKSFKTAQIPSDPDLIAVADELKELGGETHIAAGRQGTCIGIYFPPRNYYTKNIDPFTGEQGTTSLGGRIRAVCSFWYGSDICVANTMYESCPTKIHYYCKRDMSSDANLFTTNSDVFEEGIPQNVDTNDYERNPRLRQECIKIHGDHCSICGLSFEKLYGRDVKGYIHVHHLEPLASIGKSHVVDPQKDLIPVCPNCHAVLHMNNPPRTPEEVKELLNARKR